MAQISSLHELAQSGLRDLAGRRTMPNGFDRSQSRRAEIMTLQAHNAFEELLPSIPDVLMPRPPHTRWQELIAIAASNRLLKDAVAHWVRLLEAEPKPDQLTACALATAREQVAAGTRLMSRLEAIVHELEEAQVIIDNAQFSEPLDLGEMREAARAAVQQTVALQKKLDRYEESLEEDISSSN
jgi:hypothetical protein